MSRIIQIIFAVCILAIASADVDLTPRNTCLWRSADAVVNSSDSRLNAIDTLVTAFADAFKHGTHKCIYGYNCGDCCDVITPNGIDEMDNACYRHDVCLRRARKWPVSSYNYRD